MHNLWGAQVQVGCITFGCSSDWNRSPGQAFLDAQRRRRHQASKRVEVEEGDETRVLSAGERQDSEAGEAGGEPRWPAF